MLVGGNVADEFHYGNILIEYEPLTFHSFIKYVKIQSMCQLLYKTLGFLPTPETQSLGEVGKQTNSNRVWQDRESWELMGALNKAGTGVLRGLVGVVASDMGLGTREESGSHCTMFHRNTKIEAAMTLCAHRWSESRKVLKASKHFYLPWVQF